MSGPGPLTAAWEQGWVYISRASLKRHDFAAIISPGSPDLKSHSATYQLGRDQLANFPELLYVSFPPIWMIIVPSSWDSWASLIAQLVKNPSARQETLVRFLGGEDPLEKG